MATTLQPSPRIETHPTALEAWRERLEQLVADIFRPKPRLSVSQWAEQNRVLSKETSAEPGPWRNDRTPYLVEIMDSISDPEVREVVIVKSARVGYTEGVIGNGIGYAMDHDPAPILVLQPTQDDAEDWSKNQLEPMLRDSPSLRKLMPDVGTRDRKNTILGKKFPGGSLTIRGAHSPRGLRRLTARDVYMDEVSAYQVSAGQEGDPVKLGETRADTYPNRKIIKGSTPTITPFCRISRDFKRTDQRRYFVPCPHCGAEQDLKWGTQETPYGITWEKDVTCKRCGTAWGEGEECASCRGRDRQVKHKPETAVYECEHCHVAIEEHQKAEMVRRGRWIPTNPGASVRGYHLNALVSLISAKASWPNLVQEWLDAQDDREALQVFVNTVLGEPYEDRGAGNFNPTALEGRTEDYRDSAGNPVDVPDGVAVLTAMIDVQGDWVELLVRGWGALEESWLIAHHRFYGNPLSADLWARVEPLLVKPYRHAAGAELRIQCTCVDSGASTDVVYDFVLPRQARNVFATKGDKGAPGAPPVTAAQAKREGVRLFTIGTYTLKDQLFNRLQIATPGRRGYMHFCVPRPDRYNGVDAEYFAQLGAEKKIARRVKGSRTFRREYVQTRDRNEAIDLEVGALAALHILGAGVREQLGERARAITAAGSKHREAWDAPRRRRRVRSRGIE